jgi:hypothetical protein
MKLIRLSILAAETLEGSLRLPGYATSAEAFLRTSSIEATNYLARATRAVAWRHNRISLGLVVANNLSRDFSTFVRIVLSAFLCASIYLLIVEGLLRIIEPTRVAISPIQNFGVRVTPSGS